MGTGISIGASSGSVESASSLSLLFCTIFVPLTICGLVIDHSKNKELKSLLQTKRSSLLQIAKKYNAVTDLLKSEYHHKKKELGFFNSSQKESLRNAYEQQYLSNAKAFEQERTLFLDCFEATTPTAKRFKAYWKRFIAIGLLTQVIACGYTVGSMPDITTDVSTNSTVQSTTTREWNADNIPMPHLTDGSRYVSNPDKVVSEHTEQLLNRWLKRMDDSLLIESAMIIVNHVENEDPFRMAQDIFDKYKVGKNDRGLVIVLAYQDHKVRTHTGRALEADLTDIECSRLQQTYAIPSMKAEQPDSGMLYLTEAIYNTLQKMDRSLIEAAQDLGANKANVFTKVILPLSVPGIYSGIVMVFMPTVSTFAIAELLTHNKITLFGSLIQRSFGEGGIAMWNYGAALSLIMLIIIAATSFFDQDNSHDTQKGGLL
jgi:uncharacterized membrane protein YgcG